MISLLCHHHIFSFGQQSHRRSRILSENDQNEVRNVSGVYRRIRNTKQPKDRFFGYKRPIKYPPWILFDEKRLNIDKVLNYTYFVHISLVLHIVVHIVLGGLRGLTNPPAASDAAGNQPGG